MRITFVRHGLTQWNLCKRIQGQTDTPLSDTGCEQVRAWRLPEKLQSQICYVSPLQRARQTAELLGCASPFIEPRLTEMHWGEWEGESLAALRTRFGENMRANEQRGLDFRPPGGESPRDVQRRVLEWCVDLARGDDDAIAITHKGVIRAIYAAASGWDMRAPPAHELAWQHAHVFRTHRDGSVHIHALNVSLQV